MTKLKILIAHDGYHAHYFERVGWTNAFASCNFIEVANCNVKKDAMLRIFDAFEPDIFIGQLYNLDRPTIKAIKKRPHLKVALRAGEWGDFKVDTKFNILQSTEEDIKNLELLKKLTGQPTFVFTHYEQESVDQTHSFFKEKLGVPAYGILLSADVNSYVGGRYNPVLDSDIGFVGGYWPYKAQIIDQYLLPLCWPVGKYNIKIFGNQGWLGVNQYCGHIQEELVKDLFISSKICPNLSEPHAHEYGIEVNERSFKILAAGGFCIGDNIASHRRIFKNGMVFAENPNDFKEKVDYYLNNTEERQTISSIGQKLVFEQHTNYHRAAQFLKLFEYENESNLLLSSWMNFYGQNFS